MRSDFRFCPVCGGALELRSLRNGDPARLVCTACGFVFYLDPKLAVGTIITDEQNRVVIGWNDFVYLNRGTTDGLEVGSPLDVYRPGYPANEPARDETVQVPDRVVGKLVVVRAADSASVAIITNASTELRLGDRFRGAESEAGAPSETN